MQDEAGPRTAEARLKADIFLLFAQLGILAQRINAANQINKQESPR